jgi:signal transduction histidine kinase
MLNRLRWQLTLLYLLVTLGLIALVSLGSYNLLRRYFQDSTDLALQYKIATQFQLYGIPLPLELARAERDWQDQYARPSPAPTRTPTPSMHQNNGEEDGEQEAESPSSVPEGQEAEGSAGESGSHEEEAYEASLAPVFLLSSSAGSSANPGVGALPPPIALDVQAQAAALMSGTDWRTLTLQNGSQVRLLTYRNPTLNGPAVFQAGRMLDDQEHALKQLLSGLLLLGGLSAVLVGLGSWWLSGRSIRPTQQAWDHQQTFISNASHELRTPLTLIRATAEVGLRSQPDEAQVQPLKDILQETDYMNRLVDDLLLLSRLDTHRLKLERARINLAELLGETRRMLNQLAVEKGVILEAGNITGAILGDPIRMRQVLLILLDNALRFTQSGGNIRLEASPSGRACHIVVADSGCGIAPEHLPHVFERFYQVGQPGEVETRNNGLGLSIARSLVEAQGGKISLESQPGQGTRVTVSMPAAS